MMPDVVFGPEKSDGFQVSVSSLTLGTLYEAILAFSSQERFETFWPSVCKNARWLIPSQRMCILLRTGEDIFEIEGMFEHGKLQKPADAQYIAGKNQLGRVLARSNAQWFTQPWKEFHEETDELTTWLFADRPDMLFVLPMMVKGKNSGVILFVMASIQETDQAMLNTLGTIYALHVGMTYTLIRITEERRKMENQLVMQEKMAALGNLVAGVAHEVNNPIGAVNSAADVLARCIGNINDVVAKSKTIDEIKGNSKFQKALKLLAENNQVVVIAGQRIAKMVQNLKNFARLHEAEFKKADIHEGIDSTLMLVLHELKDKVEVIQEYGDIPQINCYPNQLNQVFMNLIVNAAHSIEDSGIIKIKTFVADKHVYIRISDTGKGITPEHFDRIFEPGFTTKRMGVGTGLGLSICYNIIQKHSGTITVESEVGKDTEVTLALPIHQAKKPKATYRS